MMQSFLQKSFLLIGMLGIGVTALADTSVNEVWECDLKDGKSMDDVRAANSKWVKFVNANVDGGGIGSSIVTSIVGNATAGHFLYVDSFPNLESWSATKSALDGNEEGEAIDAELQSVAECSNNRLYSLEAS